MKTNPSSTDTPQNWAIVVAAGTGSRFAAQPPKQYHLIDGQCVLEHSLAAFIHSDMFSGIVVVVAKDDSHIYTINTINAHPNITVTIGGENRSDSVSNGLAALTDLADNNDWVWVHDGARPCIDPSFLLNLHTELNHHPIGGVPAIAVTDTLKSARNRNIQKTEPRNNLWRAQTPQIFRYQLLNQAMQSAMADHSPITDESSAIEYRGLQPMLLTGKPENIKITHPHDLALAEYYLRNHGAQ